MDALEDTLPPATPVTEVGAPGAPREYYFEGLATLGELSDHERREFFIRNDNFFV